MTTQLSLFDAPPSVRMCRDCGGELQRYLGKLLPGSSDLCDACLAKRPRKVVNGQTITLTCAIAPANWEQIAPWCEDFRTVNGKRVRSAWPGLYRDTAGVVWQYKANGYERWSE